MKVIFCIPVRAGLGFWGGGGGDFPEHDSFLPNMVCCIYDNQLVFYDHINHGLPTQKNDNNGPLNTYPTPHTLLKA